MPMPDWASAVPSIPGVHPSAGQQGATRPFTQQQLMQFGADLIEQLLRRVVLALTKAFLPGIPAFDQLMAWAENIGDLLWWLEGDLLVEVISEHVGELLGINWLSPQAIWEAVTSSWDFWRGVVNWAMTVLKNITGIDLTEQSQFLKDLVALFALTQLQDVWNEFFHGWGDLNWSNPLGAIHSAWMLFVDLFWGLIGWFQQMLENLTGISLPSFLEFDALKAAWSRFDAAWNGLNWSNPFAVIHPAWMAVVDLFWDVGSWGGQVLQNLTGINLPGFFAFSEIRAAWTGFFGGWGSINWSNPLAGIHSAWMLLVDLASDVWAWVKTVLGNLTGITLPDFFDLSGIKGLWQAFTDAWSGVGGGLWAGIGAVANFIREAVHWLIGVFRNLTGINLENIAESFGMSGLGSVLSSWAAALDGIDWSNPVAGLMAAIAAFVALFQGVGNWILDVLYGWFGWDTSAVGDMFDSFGSFLERIISYFWGDLGVAGWVHTLESLAGSVGASIVEAIKAIYKGVQRLVAMFGDFSGFDDLVTFLGDIFSTDGLLGWLAGIRRMLTTPPPPLDLDAIRRQIEDLFGGTSVSQINDTAPNLLAQGNFNNEITLTAGDGITWDGSTTATGSGGSAKFTSAGSLQQLYSRQVIKVANGDKVDISAKVKTSGFTAAGGRSMELAIIPWKLVANVMTAQTAVVIHTRTTASSGSFADMTGSTYTVSGDIIRLTVRLRFTGNSGSIAWFDDVYVGKTGKMQQGFVENLLATWEQVWGKVFPGSGSGKIWTDFVDAVEAIFGKASDAYDNADDAIGVAGSAQTLAEDTNTAAYNAWYGSGGVGSATNMQTVIASIKASTVDGWEVREIDSNGNWTRPTSTSNILEFWTICIGGGGGGDKGPSGGSGFPDGGGLGGVPGRWMAKQIDPADIPGTVYCTIGAGGPGRTGTHLGAGLDNGGTTTFGSLCSSAEAETASIGSFVGFYAATDSRPGVGGRGGGEAAGAKAGSAGAKTPLAAGGAGGSVQSAGGAGSQANLLGSIRAGGGGGGGGGGANNPNAGGKGGNGGVPGGGGGGGGAAWSVGTTAGGDGGNGADGRIVLLWRVKT